ncbi:hypothetical protein KP806_07685 [Paenibacillus sp. N4]|uniref:hypothetical protein n=1 Tax=Paenibacillus vietnamensis TaxID=2590547 RepID=UPI001CD0E959|nr:hypothetical protein [Paenibacillus vietnamensis]MCA0754928.1 hypothetical protein [Paenibacillus vietnamensis]
MPRQKWTTVKVHRSYEIQINSLPDPRVPNGFGYRINDPAFLPEFKLYNSVAEAIDEIDDETA